VHLATTSLEDSIRLDFAAACADLADARQAVRVKDSPAARARCHECAALVDAILDLENATVAARV
jgi:hypothetical protein